jgi:predicted lipoprotein with Yx(FWY)xxD motif
MNVLKIPLLAAFALVAAALLAAGCGSSSTNAGSGTTSAKSSGGGYGYGGSPAASSTTTMAASKSATISSRMTSLGQILVDDNGMTIYLFEKDKGTASTCDGSCAKFWPPVTTNGAPKAGAGVTAAKLGTTKRADGTTEVTYNGHPLYLYAGDKKSGDMTGQGLNAFGALWYVLSPGGMEVVG